jgi:hypothetical protein
MSYKPLTPYTRSPRPSLSASERQWLEDELKKLEQTFRAIIAAIEELRAKVP